jgi:hypothetical protein
VFAEEISGANAEAQVTHTEGVGDESPFAHPDVAADTAAAPHDTAIEEEGASVSSPIDPPDEAS